MHLLLKSNLNFCWGGVMASVVYALGVRHAVICPGSRSAPLAVGFGLTEGISAWPVLDERSAAFFALGLAKASSSAVVLICTSGTAAANFLPALVEAHYSGVPLLVMTADRPPELRECSAGQAIDQVKLYGSYVRWTHEVALPEASLIPYLRQTLLEAVLRAQGLRGVMPGPVHLNVPLREPLVPQPDPAFKGEALLDDARVDPLLAGSGISLKAKASAQALPESLRTRLSAARKPLLILGESLGSDHLPERLAEIWPKHLLAFADVLSPVRHQMKIRVVTHYDRLLRKKALDADLIMVWGRIPTSKTLRNALARSSSPIVCFGVSAERSFSGPNALLTLPASHLSEALECLQPDASFRQEVLSEDDASQGFVKGETPAGILSEPLIPQLLAEVLPEKSSIVVASSTPIRDAEWFWPQNSRRFQVLSNRGANGIDGTLSTAAGVAVATGEPAFLVTGDLAFLHDSNGLLLAPHLREAGACLTVLVLNNNGGGIFQNLPISGFPEVFERFFGTPQSADLAQLAKAHGVSCIRTETPEALSLVLRQDKPSGIHVIEVTLDRGENAALRKRLLNG